MIAKIETYKPYNFVTIEKTVQAEWQSSGALFALDNNKSQKKYYCLSMFPYPSGQLHMGHVRNYTIGDVISRYNMMNGCNVLQPMGWDAFGLPAENAAKKSATSPAAWTENNIAHMKSQLQSLGFAYDWRREFRTCDPDYYRWQQWLFIKMVKSGLAYRKKSMVNWDPVDETVLANEQVIDGCGWRSGAKVVQKEISQWFLKITDYREELLKDLDILVDWPHQVKQMQKNWIGKSNGCEIRFTLESTAESIEVFTTRADTLFGASFIALSSEHKVSKELASNNVYIEEFRQKCRGTTAEEDMATQEKLGLNTGLFAIHPLTGNKLPVWIANFVLMEYGHGALMAVPAHDERDHEFALKYDLPILPVVQKDKEWDYQQKAMVEHGVLINSDKYSSMSSADAIVAIAQDLAKLDRGKLTTQYRLRDWGISRQRYWGTPIPMIYCDSCGIVPEAEENLPVVLPTEVSYGNKQGNLLDHLDTFKQTKCPKCNQSATRETDTFDTFVDSSWYLYRFACFDQNTKMLDQRANDWCPVDIYIGGIEHAILHLLYARFITKVLKHYELIDNSEPFKHLLTQGMVLKDGHKMSKSKGNVVSPQALIDKYGADTVRLFIIFAAPPEHTLEWSEGGVEGAHRFLKRLWNFSHDVQINLPKKLNQDFLTKPNFVNCRREIHTILQQATHDMQKLQFNTVVSAAMKMFNVISKQRFDDLDIYHVVYEAVGIILQIISPIVPHISEHLWQNLGYGKNIHSSNWPKYDSSLLEAIIDVEIIIQVNGKTRGKVQVNTELDADSIAEQAMSVDKIKSHLQDKPLKKAIYIKNKLINLVV